MPPTTISQAVKGGISGFLKKFEETEKPDAEVINIQQNLKILPPALLQQIVPDPEWKSAAPF